MDAVLSRVGLVRRMAAQQSVYPGKLRRGEKSRTVGMPSAHALGLGDGRLTLPRPMGAFLGDVSEL